MSVPYSYQAVDHDASINVARDPADPYQVTVEIWRGDKKPRRITMWLEDFERMTADVLGVELTRRDFLRALEARGIVGDDAETALDTWRRSPTDPWAVRVQLVLADMAGHS